MVFQFTIDKWTDPIIPRLIVPKLPVYVRRFLGGHSPPPRALYWIWLEILISSFVGLLLLEGVFKSNTVFKSHHAPIIIASYGATAILCFNASLAPLAQPRAILMGHFVASIIGVGIQKLFLLSASGRDHYWVAGALSVAVSSTVMSVLNCVHPPAGASALLPAIDEQIQELSWWYLPVQLVSSVLIIAVACITGNVVRKYPMYWWTPTPHSEVSHPPKEEPKEASPEDPRIKYIEGLTSITVTPQVIEVPSMYDLDELEIEWLEILQKNLTKTV